MKKVKVASTTFFVLVLISLFVMPLVLAVVTWGDIVPWGLEKVFDLLFGLKPDVQLEVGIVFLILFIMFFAAFSDIIRMFTLFSKTTSYILGFGLALITAMTRATFVLATLLFSVVGGLGIVAIVVAVATAFIVFLLIHVGSYKFLRWMIKRKYLMEAHRKGAEALAGLEVAKEIGKWAAKGA